MAVQQDAGEYKTAGEKKVDVWKIITKSLASKTPYFQVTMTEWMVSSRAYRVEFPSEFVQKHRDKFQASVTLERSWTSGQVWSTRIKIMKSFGRIRASFNGGGWKLFVIANELKIGDLVIFMILETSRFLVHVYPMPVEIKGWPSLAVRAGDVNQSRAEFGNTSRLKGKTETPSDGDNSEVRSAVARTDQKQKQHLASREQMTLGDTVITASSLTKKAVETCEPNASFKFPFFMKKLLNINMGLNNGGHIRARLEVPSAFVRSHGKDLEEMVKLCTSNSKVMDVKCVSYKSSGWKGATRVQFTDGWREFLDENGSKKGDTLIFSLKAPARFDVDLLPESAPKS